MRRWNWVVPALAALGLAASAHAADPLVSLYRGDPARQSNLLLGGWGSGTVKESSDEVLRGSRSLLVTTGGYYSGARIDFSRPVDMSRFGSAKGVALRLELKAPGANSGTDNTGAPIPGGGYFQGGYMPGGPPMGPGRPPGLPGGPPMPGVPGYNPGMGTEPTEPLPASQRVRVVLFSNATQVAAVDQPVDAESVNNGWVPVTIPLAAFRGSGGAPANWSGFRLTRMLLFGDRQDTFNVGDISLIQTDLTITGVSAGDDQEIYQGDTAEFTGKANGAGLKYSWDFNATDGIQEDAIGPHVFYKFRKAGTYTVTLTVSDPNGVMPPVSDKIQVVVNG